MMDNQSIDTKLKQLIASAYKLGRIAQEDNLSKTDMADELRVLQSQSKLILASRPTCGKEQRLFLDEVEKGALSCYDELSNPKKYILRFGNGYRLYDDDFQGIDLSKVIRRE